MIKWRKIVIRSTLAALGVFAIFQNPSPEPLALPPNTIELGSGEFNPPRIDVKVGETVTWKNRSQMKQDLLAQDRSFAPEAIYPGQSFSFKFDKPGEYVFTHSENLRTNGQIGTVVVRQLIQRRK